MALSTAGSTASVTSVTTGTQGGSPAFTAPLFFLGTFLTFLGERVLPTLAIPRAICTTLGCGAMLVATLIRWGIGARAPSERGRIERLLGVAQLGAIIAIALALATSLAPSVLGLSKLDPERREFWDTSLLIGWVVLLLVSLLPLAFAESALIPMRRAKHPESRRVVAAASAGLTIALAVSYLGLFVGSAHRYGVAADYAYFKTAKASQSTIAIAKNLKDPIRIVAFFPSLNEVRNEVDKYLREVARSSPKIRIEYVDRVLQPKVARELRVEQDGTLVLSRGEARQIMSIGLELKTARTTLRNFDQEFQKNLMKLARDARVAYLTVGHRELNDGTSSQAGNKDKGRSITILRKLLEMQNYRIADLGMPQGLGSEIPDDANVVMVLGPRDPFAPEEVASLKRYVGRGGALLLALDAEAVAHASGTEEIPPTLASAGTSAAPPKTSTAPAVTTTHLSQLSRGGIEPNLNELAALTGLSVQPTILADDRGSSVNFSGNKSDRARIATDRFGSHASVSTLSRNSAWVVLFGTGSLSKLDPNDKAIDFAVRSAATTFGDTNGNFDFDSSETRQSFDIGAAVTRKVNTPAPLGPNAKEQAQRSFVLADADLFSDVVLKNALMNRLLLLDAVRWLGGEESIAGETTSEEDVRIEHTKQKDVFWFYGAILGVPALVLGLGLYLSRRTRRKGEGR